MLLFESLDWDSAIVSLCNVQGKEREEEAVDHMTIRSVSNLIVGTDYLVSPQFFRRGLFFLMTHQ